MTCRELLAQLNELDEHRRVEAKTGQEAGPSVLDTVCAFANEPGLDGGWLLLGVSRREAPDRTYDVVGVADPDRLQADLATQCAATFNRPVRPETWTETIDGRTVVGVYIPESQAGDKPIFLRSRGLPKGAYRRIGSTDQRCTEDDLLVFYEARSGQTFDEMPVADATPGDIDPEAVADYRRARGVANPEAVELGWTDEELLRALGCVTLREGRPVPTVAGIVLFGTAIALRRCLPMMRLDYIRVPGREWVADPERGFESIDMRGPLMRLVQRAVAAVLDDLPKGFRLPPGEMQRVDEPVIPVRVLREALVNALMHRSYRLHGAVQVIRYSNRLEIRNPGHSLVAEERLGEPSSRTRNPRIAAVLHETRFAETKGSGIRVMREAMASANLSPPTFESDRDKDEFVTTLLFHHFLSDVDVQWLARFQDFALTSDEAKALVFVRETGAIHNAAYRNLNGVDTLAASARLRHLRDIGLLEQHDRGSATYYTPTARLVSSGVAAAPALLQPELPLDAGQSQGSEALSQGVQPLSQGFEPQSQGFEPQSQGFQPVPQGAVRSESDIPGELLEAVRGLGRRHPPKEVRAVVRRLCEVRAFSADEMAQLLGRGKGYVVRTYLTPMVRDGELEFTIPGSPAHPKQCYRVPGRNDPDSEAQ